MGIAQYPDPLDKYVICTSSSRPAAYEGLMIYETDTDRVYVSSGSAWKYVSSATMEHVEHKEFVPVTNRDVTSATTVDWTTETTAVTVPAWATSAIITSHVVGFWSVTADCGAAIRTSFGGVDSTYENSYTVYVNGRAAASWVDEFTGLSAGAATLKPRARRSSGTGTLRADTSTHFSYKIEFMP